MDLLSIAAPAASVAVGPSGESIEVRGLTLRDIAALLARFPEVLTMFKGGDIDLTALLAAAPGAAAAIMAAGAGHVGNPAAEDICAALSVEYQTNVLIKIGELTFPGGIGPFAERMAALSSSLPGLSTNGAAEPDHAMPAMN